MSVSSYGTPVSIESLILTLVIRAYTTPNTGEPGCGARLSNPANKKCGAKGVPRIQDHATSVFQTSVPSYIVFAEYAVTAEFAAIAIVSN